MAVAEDTTITLVRADDIWARKAWEPDVKLVLAGYLKGGQVWTRQSWSKWAWPGIWAPSGLDSREKGWTSFLAVRWGGSSRRLSRRACSRRK
jgi:hypothetical protein